MTSIEKIEKSIKILESREIKEKLFSPIKNLKIDYESLLNEEQQRALFSLEGKYLVIAGAGSGKTRILTYRSAYLIESGIKPQNILMITFTKKATLEMKSRIKTLIGKKANILTVSTFHSFAYQILARYNNGNRLIDIMGNDEIEYDLLIEELIRILMVDAIFRSKLQSRYKYIMVDEYQDCNDKQTQLLKLLVGSRGNIMAVGDDFQSIYGFRGSNIENIFCFIDTFSDAKLIKLRTNYRSYDEIIRYINKVSRSFRVKYRKNVVGTGKKGGRIFKNRFKSEERQWEYIGDKIVRLKDEGIDYSEMAILFRNRYAVVKIEKYLKEKKVPYYKKEDKAAKGVALVSVHSAKGLEWEVVFLPTMLEGIFPTIDRENQRKNLEEEKRLFYVACSRAKRYLFLLYPYYYYEKTGYHNIPSRFLDY